MPASGMERGASALKLRQSSEQQAACTVSLFVMESLKFVSMLPGLPCRAVQQPA